MKKTFLQTVKDQLNPIAKVRRESFRSITNSVSEAPEVFEKKNVDWVFYGKENLYPSQLFDLKYGSAIHNSILKTKGKMMAGDGLLLNGLKTKEESDSFYKTLQGTQKAELDYLLKNKRGGTNLETLQDYLAQDYQDYGAYAYKLIFNNDFTKLSGIKYYKAENIRSGKEVNGKVENYYYAKDWSKSTGFGFKPEKIAAYYEGNKNASEQMVYRKIGNADYYGIVNYSGCLNWIHTDLQMSIFHRANIENGMNPGLHFKFYKVPASTLDEDIIISNLIKQWQGAAKTNKMVATFSESKELGMDISPVETSNLDKQLLLLAELCDKKILTGHQLTSPLLAGVSVSGQLGGNTELETGWQIFDGLSMAADRKVLRNDIEFWFEFNKIGIDVNINKFKPFETIAVKNPQFTISSNG